MKQKWETVGDYSVEIWFRIGKDEGGYPRSKNWEQLLAKPLLEGDDYFPKFTERELLQKGLVVEGQNEDFFAVDVPPSVDQKAIDAYLVAESESGRWEMQDGYLHSIRTH